jgi:hypothetical protein
MRAGGMKRLRMGNVNGVGALRANEHGYISQRIGESSGKSATCILCRLVSIDYAVFTAQRPALSATIMPIFMRPVALTGELHFERQPGNKRGEKRAGEGFLLNRVTIFSLDGGPAVCAAACHAPRSGMNPS